MLFCRHGAFQGMIQSLLDLAGAPVQDLRRVLLPRKQIWTPGQFWLIDVYDWDTIIVDGTSVAVLNFNFLACSGALPCFVNIEGNPTGSIQHINSGSVLCLASAGCYGIAMKNIQIDCNSQQTLYSVLRIQGSTLSISNCIFTGCNSATDGGLIQSYDRANVSITRTIFNSLRSSGFGGALVAFGSCIRISHSEFQNCSSEGGGGAIWASGFTGPYGSLTQVETCLDIQSTLFQNCNSNGAGGAILIVSEASFSNVRYMVKVEIRQAIFEQCKSLGNGGALRAYGFAVDVTLVNSSFIQSWALGSGGAVSVNSSTLTLIRSIFQRNIADGSGGGALHVQNSYLMMYDLYFRENSAMAGGGGVLFWEGNLYPAMSSSSSCPPSTISIVFSCADFSNSYTCSWRTCGPLYVDTILDSAFTNNICKQVEHNYALFGPCVASEYKRLQVLKLQETIFPGLPFSVIAIKLDAYNQTINSDSSSVLQAYLSIGNTVQSGQSGAFSLAGGSLAKLDSGVAIFTLSIRPMGLDINVLGGVIAKQLLYYIAVEGSDSQTGLSMRSTFIPVLFGKDRWTDSDVCPSGYILEVDQPFGSENGTATCTFCKSGTYSTNPLAWAPDSPSANPACITCPAGGDCRDGGSFVNFQVGEWLIVGGVYLLQRCPAGYQLVNSSSGSSSGVFSNALQQCQKCLPGKYIINPNHDQCRICPAGKSAIIIVLSYQ